MRFPKLRARAPLYAICFGLFANAYAMTNPFSYVAFLVESYGIHQRPACRRLLCWMDHVRLHGGPRGVVASTSARSPIAAAASPSSRSACSRAPSSSCSLASRRPLPWAVAARLAMGLFNGIIAVAKAAIPEVVPASEQTVAMSWLAGVWGIAMVAGPAAGGLMVDTEAGQYLAPNALGSVLAVASIIAVHVYVPKVKGARKVGRRSAGPRAPDGGRGGGQERRRAAAR